MSFRTSRQHFEDILESISKIEQYSAGLEFDNYLNDEKTRLAIERLMQIITEAAYRLGDEAEKLCPGPDWKGYMGMGNLLRHAYHRIDDKIVWDTIQIDLPMLKESIKKALEQKTNG